MVATRALTPLEVEARTTRKVWVRVIPFVLVLFVINYIDRVNIGFAALTMNRELAITSQQYGFIAGIFFLGYFVFEIPSNLLLHRLWCFAAMGIWSFFGPFWALPNEFLIGSSAAVGIALINSFGNLGGFVGPYAMGAIGNRTGSFQGGLLFAAFSLFVSASLVVMLPNTAKTERNDA